jgi:hypothetical protein
MMLSNATFKKNKHILSLGLFFLPLFLVVKQKSKSNNKPLDQLTQRKFLT